MGTYVNNLSLLEITTGDESGTWGTKTNTNLELIGEAFGYGTRAIANASTDNITIANGASDADRSMYLKLTGGGQACTVTLLPATASKVWIMENATSYTLTFTCGGGANVAILAGETKIIATDGGGGSGVVYDVLTDLNLAGTTKVDDLTVGDDLVVGGDIDLEGAIDVNGTANLDVVDIDGAVDMATTALVTGVLTTTATQVATGGVTSGSDIISDTNSTDSLGATGTRWLKGWFDTLTAGTLTIGSGSVTDSSGAITFGNENLTTTGIVTAAGTSVFTNLDISGDVDVDGTTNLDIVDIDGAVDMATTALVTGVLTTTATQVANGGITSGDDISVGATDKIFLDGGNNTYITESAADVISIYTENMETYVLGGSGNPYVRIQAGAGGGTATTQYYEGGEFFWQHGVRGADEKWYLTGNATLHSSYALMIDGQDVTVGGALAKGSGSFKIDHPLPSMKDTHHLVHSFIEGPRADLIYRGSVALSGGSASVDLDEEVGMTDGTWELLCRDPQVFLQNESGWSALKGSVSGSTLIITCKDSISIDTVSWMVVAERQDEHMMDTNWTDSNGRPIIEPEKPEDVEDGS